MTPLCLVLMPAGRRIGAGGAVIDFDAVYRELLAPAVQAAGLEPLRADTAAGVLQPALLEQLLLCDLLLADLSAPRPAVSRQAPRGGQGNLGAARRSLASEADAGLYYALGLRHGARPGRTVVVHAAGCPPLLEAGALQALAYTPGAAADRGALAARLRQAQAGGARPVHELVDGFAGLQRLKTDVFRTQVDYTRQLEELLAAARAGGTADALRALQAELAAAAGGLAGAEAGVLVDLLLSYRALQAWDDMIALVPRLAPPLAATPLVQEQLGFALNRAGRPDEAERVLQGVIARRGPSSETCSLLGRVHKDRWEAAQAAGDAAAAQRWLARAIAAYLQGFETDWRDAYPGVNAVTLMELQEPPDPRRKHLLPVVRYAVERRVAAGPPDYWDHATRIELAVLDGDETGARQALADALAAVREAWEPESTARNLRLIRQARERRGAAPASRRAIEDALAGRAQRR